MYNLFYRSLISFITAKGLSLYPVTGTESKIISDAQSQLKKTIPLSIVEWFIQAGNYSADWREYDSDLTFRDFINSQEVAMRMMNDPLCKWRLTDIVLPISSRIGGEFLFIMADMGDDPPVYHYLESADYPTRYAISFTSYIRERVLARIDFGFKSDFLIELGFDKRREIIPLIDEAYRDLEMVRKDFTERVHTEDIAKRHLTDPQDFQIRWVEEIRWLKVTHDLIEKHLYVPWNWT